MSNSDNDNYNAGNRPTNLNIGSRPPGDSERHKPVLDDFDDEETYEESDRDTDYASIYTEDILEDDEIEELLRNARSEESDAEDFLMTANEANSAHKPDTNSPAEDRSPDAAMQSSTAQWGAEVSKEDDYGDTSPRWSGTDPREEFRDELEDDDNELWEDEDNYDSEERATWPLGLIAVAVIALLLLGAGGYGVVQQRSAMESEIRELQAALATAASPEDVAASREEVTKMRSRYEELRITLNSLNLENRRLRDTVTGLESQLAAQQEVAKAATKVSPPAPPKPATPTPPAPKPVATKPAAPKPAATTSGSSQAAIANGWFVNFGSYSKRATAESWANRVQPAAGKVIVATGDKAGTTFYRVRVVNLPSKDQAERVARELEKSYGLSRLWVGKQ